MRLGLLAGTLVAALLVAAGSSVALIEAVEIVAGSAEHYAEAAVAFAEGTAPGASAGRVADDAVGTMAAWEALVLAEGEESSGEALDVADGVVQSVFNDARNARGAAFDAASGVVAQPPTASVEVLQGLAQQGAGSAANFTEQVASDLQGKANAVGTVGTGVTSNLAGQANAAVALAAGAAGDPSGNAALAQAFAEQLAADAQGKANAAINVASNATSNVAGQANAAVALGTFVATQLALALQQVVQPELGALLALTHAHECASAPDPVTCASVFVTYLVEA